MTEERKCFTFIWKIRNFDFSFNGKEINSPTFFPQEMSQTKWKIYICTNSFSYNGYVSCYLHRGNDSGPYQFELDYELSFLTDNGFVQHSEIFLKKVFTKGMTILEALRAKRDEVFLQRKNLIIPKDLTIRCRMWDNKEPLSKSGTCFGETVIETEQRNSIGTIEKFSNTEANCKTMICIKPSAVESFFSSMNLCVFPDGKLGIEIKSVNLSHMSMYRCKIYIRDIFGNKVISGQGIFHDKDTHCITLTLLKEYLMDHRDYYLPNDILTIEFEITFATGNTTEKLGETEYGSYSLATQETISSASKTDFSLKKQNNPNLTTLKDDLISIFKEDILCDTKLKTATETFPAHTVVLSARSSVFRSMFTTDMKEKTNNCVDIDDLDADTVRRMLLFMYSDTLDDEEYDSTKSLYFAADKYNIVSLRSRCSNILQRNLLVSNCCDVLLLADKHQDKDLKNAVLDYIVKSSEAVLFSEDWKNLEENHPKLGIEVFRHIYTKNQRI